MKQELPITFDTKVVIRDAKTREVLREGKNAIHPQNMSRVIARALANEPNALIHRIAFGNGGTYTDAAGNVVFNPPNDGMASGWEARIYNETYSEVVDESHPDFKSDPGSADVNTVRMAGGASPSDDPEGGGVTSVEVGRKSNIVITMVINENEPSGQLASQNLGPVVEADETYFMFDEIGLYSPGRPAKSTNGYSTVNVGTAKLSTSTTNLSPNSSYTFPVVVDGASLLTTLRTPASGTGVGGAFTYGDICEGINTGAWVDSGDNITNFLTAFITDRSGGAYPTILGMNSYGFLTFQSKTVGVASSVSLTCNAQGNNFFNVLTNGVCGNVNVNASSGIAAGAANDPVNPDNERERLLTHFIFDPILKSSDRAIEIEYTLTVSVGRTADSQIVQVTATPTPVESPTPTPTNPVVTVTVTATPEPTPTLTCPPVTVTVTAPSEPVEEEISISVYRQDGTEVYDGDFEEAFTVHRQNSNEVSTRAYIRAENLASDGFYKFTLTDWALGESETEYEEGEERRFTIYHGQNSSFGGGDDGFEINILNGMIDSEFIQELDADVALTDMKVLHMAHSEHLSMSPDDMRGTVVLKLLDGNDEEVAMRVLPWRLLYEAW